MDKDARNAIERATQQARKVLETDFAAQLEGDFDVRWDGVVAARAGDHLSPRQAFQRERIIAAIEHKRAAGMSADEAAQDYLRDAAFTTLNRFVALKMLEARELLQECITKGEESIGYREFCGMAPGLQLLSDSAGYRLYIESVFDELSTEVRVLFERRDPSSVLWPRRAAFEKLLDLLNAPELTSVWGEDETIGWVYQFFNGDDERRQMREESQAPRSSRELAVRNQFFTPRYVVRFLVDNTLGRIWYEMRSTATVLVDKCEFMDRDLRDGFEPRTKKDPRDLRVLDPACGSGHFLLYAFDLFLEIYQEAHSDPSSPCSEATGNTLAEDYPSVEALLRALPGLVISHNLYGVDIDSRCAQIAQLALWMRGQKACRDFGIPRNERLRIRRSNIVVAEPLAVDGAIVGEFVSRLGDAELGRVFMSLVEALSLAGDLGLLLRLEDLVGRKIELGQTGDLFFPAEERIRNALELFVREGARITHIRRRLFADDAAHGLGLLAICELRFDVVLMNPPFGKVPKRSEAYLRKHYEGCWTDVYGAFLCRFLSRRERPWVGAITSSLFLYTKQMRNLRSLWIDQESLRQLVELGPQVLDGATVETALTVSGDRNYKFAGFLDATNFAREQLEAQLRNGEFRWIGLSRFRQLPLAPLCYHISDSILEIFGRSAAIDPDVCTVAVGNNTFDDFRFLRLRWEVEPTAVGEEWFPYEVGGEYQALFAPSITLYRWGRDGREARAFQLSSFGTDAQVRQSSKWWFSAGITYPRVSSIAFGPRWLPAGHIFSGDSISAFAVDSKDVLPLLGHLASSWAEEVTQIYGRYRKIEARAVAALPFAQAVQGPDSRRISELAMQGITEIALLETHLETSPLFCGVDRSSEDWAARTTSVLSGVYDEIDHLVARSLFIDQDPPPLTVPDRKSLVERLACVSEARKSASQIGRISFAVGLAFGRWHSERCSAVCREAVVSSLLREARLPLQPPASRPPMQRDVLVDDEGHRDDIITAVLPYVDEEPDLVRRTIREELFAFHLAQYSRAGRRAPIYWQLSTTSAEYSVWLYFHGCSKDSLFRIQSEYVAPKLAHEERRLESLASELHNGATAAQRKQLASQEAFVDELRAFLRDVKLVAPLWNPILDDGVIINFALLWRLVPHSKSWQRALKSKWDAIVEGEYDWCHLAMRLWPERVVPKCAKDRSIAIAHGLEDVFWIQDSDGKWSPRTSPTTSVDQLVKERASQAVKAALTNLLDAPVASGKSAGRRSGVSRKSAAASEGVDA